jgi:hypothetical protein
MRKKAFLFKALRSAFVSYALLSCATSPPSAPPLWYADTEAVYPGAAYITGRGEGGSRKEAENRALAEIGYYFVRHIHAEQSTRASWTEQNGEAASERFTEESVAVESHTRLVAVRYAQDPWFDSISKSWHALAYIDRAEGWAVYEPLAQKQADAFLSLVKAADAETEAFNAALRWGTVAAYAEGAEYKAARDFAQALNPSAAVALFVKADAAQASLIEKQLTAREKSPVFVECPLDHERLIYQAAVKTLNAMGFTVETNSGAAAAFCVLQAEEGGQKTDGGSIYYPSLTGTVSGNGGVLFSFKIEGGRQGAVNPDLAKRRAYMALSSALEKGFPEELKKRQSALLNE